MPVRIIGKKSPYTGSYLFEILNNLKNYGIGRLVAKNSYNEFPEPSYMIVRKVIPMREVIGVGPEELYYGKVWVDEVFRGRKLPGLRLLMDDTLFTNFRLISKEDEPKYLSYEYKEGIKILPKYDVMPPTLSIILKKKMELKEDPKLELVYQNLSEHLVYKVQEDGETPNYDLSVKIPPRFLDGVKEI